MTATTFIVVTPSASDAACRQCPWTYSVGSDSDVDRKQRAAKVNMVARLHRESHRIRTERIIHLRTLADEAAGEGRMGMSAALDAHANRLVAENRGETNAQG